MHKEDIVLTLLFLFLIYKVVTSRRSSYPLPPGPKGYPIIGNIFDIPKTFSWKTYAKWSDTWGNLISLKIFGQVFVIVNDVETAINLLHKTGSAVADRPVSQMAEMSGWDRVLSAAHYTESLHHCRKLIGDVVGSPKAMTRFYHIEDHQANMFIKRVLSSNIEEAARKTGTALVLHYTYGYKINEEGTDRFVEVGTRAIEEFTEIHRPGAYLVDILTFLKYVPAWFPGAGFKRTALAARKTVDQLADFPMKYVEADLAAGHENISIAADLITHKEVDPKHLDALKWAIASFYIAGSDTTAIYTEAYFLAMTKYPEVQRRLHEEMDRVIGTDRLPTLEDRDSLPLVEATVKELFRWITVVPLAAPHVARQDIVFNNYFIPKGAMVLPNVWYMCNREEDYPDSTTFNPDRFMGASPAPDPRRIGLFGYGRRQCPGKHLGDVSVWIIVAKAIACLNVTRALDENNQPIDPVVEMTDGLLSHPKPFKCVVSPRSEKAIALINEAVA